MTVYGLESRVRVKDFLFDFRVQKTFKVLLLGMSIRL